MTGARMRPALVVGLLLSILAVTLQGVQSEDEPERVPSEDLCRPYIEKALKDIGTGSLDQSSAEIGIEIDQESHEATPASEEAGEATDDVSKEESEAKDEEGSVEEDADGSKEATEEQIDASEEKTEGESEKDEHSKEAAENVEVGTAQEATSAEITEGDGEQVDSSEKVIENEAAQRSKTDRQSTNQESTSEIESNQNQSASKSKRSSHRNQIDQKSKSRSKHQINRQQINQSIRQSNNQSNQIEEEGEKTEETEAKEGKSEEEDTKSEGEGDEDVKLRSRREVGEEGADESTEEAASEEEQEPTPEEELIQEIEIEIPENLRPRDHINQLLKLDEENAEKERAIQREADIILRDLKRLYDNAIKPLETMYKYRDLSNRHFGDPEIFSKPLVLFMGPWSGGKSSIINYLLDIEYKPISLRTGGLRECLEEHCKSPNGKNDTGAEPSPAYFNIIMHGEEEEILDGTQLAADWTFSGLQKFGQGLLDRLRGLRLNNKLLERVNIVEIPGILEIRKQVQRLFPFNDACQWFIDRADIIFLVYDPAKLDVGPETEAILDQLKGREYQTRIILNKADQVKPEELMRVQGALIWNISPLMSSAEPPIMYSTSLWSIPYEAGAPIRLLYAQERAFLRDLRSAINKRVEHKIASARRFAVRVRNHAKMVDCYLTTYYNHKTFFGNKREISDKIIENPQDYHIYEGLSTLTNISRYDLPDPDVYRDFFRLNPLYDFPLLSSTCTYFRGCPINRLDVAIAYDLPELVGKYKKSVESVLHGSEGNSPPS
ncbi:sarcalumenin [Cataglyphis hispanica]|uniref:sarcalumenin n=1 Tax=Cataglyphis hispanica TaxID=1086592 RepID=UPI00217F804F|nr:sarcalumenin [Cataglyphis hispanica]